MDLLLILTMLLVPLTVTAEQRLLQKRTLHDSRWLLLGTALLLILTSVSVGLLLTRSGAILPHAQVRLLILLGLALLLLSALASHWRWPLPRPLLPLMASSGVLTLTLIQVLGVQRVAEMTSALEFSTWSPLTPLPLWAGILLPLLLLLWAGARSSPYGRLPAAALPEGRPASSVTVPPSLWMLPEIAALRQRLERTLQAAKRMNDPLWQFDATSVLNEELPATLSLHGELYGDEMTDELRAALHDLEFIATRRGQTYSRDGWTIQRRYLADRAAAGRSPRSELDLGDPETERR